MAYTTTSFMPLKMPTPGSREPAQISLINENMVVVSGHDHANGKGVPVATVRSGLAANRPAPSAAGGIYFATDTGIVSLDNGSTWTEFLTSGGAATVTGWTLIDPIIRDTLLFGPEPTGTADTTIARVSANALQFSGNVGVGVAPAAWGGVKAFQTGAFIVWADTSQTARAGTNTYYDGTTNRAVSTGASSYFAFDGDLLVFRNAPSVAAGAEQAHVARLTVDQAGQVGIGTSNPVVAWTSPYKNIQMGLGGAVYAHDGYPQIGLAANLYYDASSQPRYVAAGLGARLLLGQDGTLYYDNAPNGAAGGLATVTQRFKVDGSGVMHVNPSVESGGIRMAPAFGDQYWLSAEKTGGKLVLNCGTGGWFDFTIGPWLAGLAMWRMQWGHGTNSAIAAMGSGGGAEFIGTNWGPYYDAYTGLGQPTQRWATVYASNGTIQTSHVSQKEHFAALDPAACVQAVLDTQWWSFDYKPPVMPELPPPPADETEEQRVAREQREQEAVEYHERMVAETADSRKQKGFVLGSPDHQTADLFGQADRRSASPSSDLAVVACALQDALRRLAVLEANNATA